MRMTNRFFCHYFRIPPENPHYTCTREYFSLIADSLDAVLAAIYVEKRAIQPRSRDGRGDVTR